MSKYHELRIWGYQHGGENPINEYNNRFNSFGTVQTGLKINPIFNGERSNKVFELFSVPLPEIQLYDSKIQSNSRKIAKLVNDLPGIASEQLFMSTLRDEILSTNEIEGVKTTNEEIETAIIGRNSEKTVRLQSFARMYFKIKQQEPLVIHELTDIRSIYDELLHGEIADDNLPNGQLFRNASVRIGNSTKTVHLPKATEVEFLPDLMKWIEFINRDIPFLIKAFIAHYYFEYIHPFFDGNGRLGRYITCAYLGYKLDPFTAIIFSKEINNQRKRYYDAFVGVEEPKNYGEATFFVKTMMEILLDGQQALIEELETKQSLFEFGSKKIQKQFNSDLKGRCLFVYYQAYLFNDSGAGIEDRILYEYLDDAPKTKIRRILDELVDDGLLEKTKKSPITRRSTTKLIEAIIN